MALELFTARRFVYSRLFSEFGAEYPIIELDDEAPGYPHIAYDLTPLTDTSVMSRTIMAKLEAVVRIVSEGGVAAQAEPLRRIQSALDRPTGLPEAVTTEETSGWVQECRRIGQAPQIKGYREGSNVPIRQNGLRFEVIVQERARAMSP